ncbi:hypothetical protein GM160_00700 [Guyparkeria halophila]|uniref:Zinc ribbon domain-containing protein n=1 Tax=Guyparkeria halophila TaxID=47960 RepID=A0A6I6CSU9_9GAMM|nr:zinc ribbon domain-containing protein [Guyparkeria halophila]QGT77516.1 hypothetical protein GM160_00700 [Guyparkeria halophila]
MDSEHKKCPACAEEIKKDAVKCKHCGEYLGQPSAKAEKENDQGALYVLKWVAIVGVASYALGTWIASDGDYTPPPQTEPKQEVESQSGSAPESPKTSDTNSGALKSGAVSKEPPAKVTTFTEEDVLWHEATAPYKAEIVQIINRIARENTRCDKLLPSTVSKAGSKSSPGDTVFYVTCEADGASPYFNVYFRASDANGDKNFAAKDFIQKQRAAKQCATVAKEVAINPDSVVFSPSGQLDFTTYPSGRARLVTNFTARTPSGVDMPYTINCLFDGDNLIETHVLEND